MHLGGFDKIVPAALWKEDSILNTPWKEDSIRNTPWKDDSIQNTPWKEDSIRNSRALQATLL